MSFKNCYKILKLCAVDLFTMQLWTDGQTQCLKNHQKCLIWTLTLKMVKITLAVSIKIIFDSNIPIFKHHDLSIKNVNRFWWICIIMPSIKISSYLRCGILLQGLWLYNCVLLSAVLMMLLATQGRTLRATKEINSITRWISSFSPDDL